MRKPVIIVLAVTIAAAEYFLYQGPALVPDQPQMIHVEIDTPGVYPAASTANPQAASGAGGIRKSPKDAIEWSDSVGTSLKPATQN